MADTPLLNTNTYTLALMQTTTTAAGVATTIPMPVSETVTAASSSPSINVTVIPDATPQTTWLLAMNATVAESDLTNGGGGITITLTDSTGDVSDVVGPLSVVGAPAVVSIANAPLSSLTVSGTQAVPTAPGP